jgi:hypothetical protein
MEPVLIKLLGELLIFLVGIYAVKQWRHQFDYEQRHALFVQIDPMLIILEQSLGILCIKADFNREFKEEFKLAKDELAKLMEHQSLLNIYFPDLQPQSYSQEFEQLVYFHSLDQKEWNYLQTARRHKLQIGTIRWENGQEVSEMCDAFTPEKLDEIDKSLEEHRTKLRSFKEKIIAARKSVQLGLLDIGPTEMFIREYWKDIYRLFLVMRKHPIKSFLAIMALVIAIASYIFN